MTQIAVKVATQNSTDVFNVIRRSPVCRKAEAVKILNECWTASDKVWAGMIDGEIACLWGLIPPTFLSSRAYLWMLTTDLIEDHKFLFIRYSQRYVEEMLKVYPIIYGHVLANNRSAKKWIQWLGGEFITEHNGAIAFVIEKRNG